MLMTSQPPTEAELNNIRRKRSGAARGNNNTTPRSVAASWADAFRVAAAERGDNPDEPQKPRAQRIGSTWEDALVGAGATLKDENTGG